jgi:hypothetical protein
VGGKLFCVWVHIKSLALVGAALKVALGCHIISSPNQAQLSTYL